jgi:hypothetical protein
MRTAEAARLCRLGAPTVATHAAGGNGTRSLNFRDVILAVVVSVIMAKGTFIALLKTHWSPVRPIALRNLHRSAAFTNRFVLELGLPQKFFLLFQNHHVLAFLRISRNSDLFGTKT